MNDTEAACGALDTVGTALTAAVTHQLKIVATVDGWPSRGADTGRSSDSTSTTERAAIALLGGMGEREHEASRAKGAIEDIRDWWTGLRIYLADGARLAARHRAPHEKHNVLLCDGRQFEGSEIAWVPHSRAHDNGWCDPLCYEAADASGLCVRCRVRERRWRQAHGKPARKRNAYEPAA